MSLLKDIFGTNFSVVYAFNSFAVILFLSLFSFKKMQRIKERESEIKKLKENLEEMDEQARLIVKTDLELSQIQEELDRKITSLLALQRFSYILTSSLEEEKIFASIKEDMVTELGFDLCLIVLKDNQDLAIKVRSGLRSKEKPKDLIMLMKDKGFLNLLARHKLLYHGSSLASFELLQQYLKEDLKLKSYIAAPIQSKEDALGAIILGNYSEEGVIGGAKEVIEILSRQIAQALENINLFERLYNSQKELEDKIKERTQDLQNALEQIKKISGLKTEFVSAVSHELRTPLTSVKGYASLLMQEKFGKLPQETKVRLERINEQADTLVNMINGLLDIARIESGRMKLEIQKIDLAELIKRVGDYLFPQLGQKNIELKLKLPPALFIEADKKLIERVLVNLLNNSVKFTPRIRKSKSRPPKKRIM